MDSVDRSTLIDFALGRLNDAETAALARRAEEDSEFAQTLDALRRELATLDDVRPSTSFLFSRRAPQLLLGPPVSQSLDVENRSPITSDAAQDDETLSVDAAEAPDERVVFLNAAPSNAVKVRRIGPVYPYYSEDGEESVAESSALQAVFPSTRAEDGRVEKNSQDLEAPKSEKAQIGEAEQAEESAQISEEEQAEESAQISEEEQAEEETQINEEEQVEESAQISEEEQAEESAQIDEEEQAEESAQISEEEQAEESAQINEEEQAEESAQINEEEQAEESAQINEEEQAEESAQINEEEQAEEETQISEEEQAEETQIDEAEQAEENAQIDEEEQAEESAQTDENLRDGANASFAQAPPRASRRFPFIPKFIASPRDARRSPFVAKKARQLDVDVSAVVRPLDERQDASDQDGQTFVYRDLRAPNDELNFASPKLAAETPDLTSRLDEQTRQDSLEENGEKEADANFVVQHVAETPRLTSRLGAVETLSPAERRLAELLGRRPSKIELDEYYWEPIVETSEVEYESEQRASLFKTAGRWATAPAIAVGRATLAICGVERRSALGSDAFAATKPRRRRQTNQFSDMMISIVSGVLIAVVVVFPLMRLAVKEVFTTIAKSAVRKIGVNVAISENAPQSDLLPFISEQLVFPRYDESAELQPPVDAPRREPSTRLETLAPVDDANDPASTPPTLAPAPFDAADAAPFLLPQNAQE